MSAGNGIKRHDRSIKTSKTVGGVVMAALKNACICFRNRLRRALTAEDGMGVVEVILIIVVLIGLVIIFQTNIKSVVSTIFSTIETNAGKIR